MSSPKISIDSFLFFRGARADFFIIRNYCQFLSKCTGECTVSACSGLTPAIKILLLCVTPMRPLFSQRPGRHLVFLSFVISCHFNRVPNNLLFSFVHGGDGEER